MTEAHAPAPDRPGEGLLSDVRVVESSLLGPAELTSFLVDLGAEVVKVEPPGRGETGRASNPFLVDEDGRRVGATYLRNNLGKRSIAIHLKHEAGRALFRRLVPHFDVVAENFRAGSLDALGLVYEALAALHPRLHVAFARLVLLGVVQVLLVRRLARSRIAISIGLEQARRVVLDAQHLAAVERLAAGKVVVARFELELQEVGFGASRNQSEHAPEPDAQARDPAAGQPPARDPSGGSQGPALTAKTQDPGLGAEKKSLRGAARATPRRLELPS